MLYIYILFSLNRPGVLLVDDETENIGLGLQCYLYILFSLNRPGVLLVDDETENTDLSLQCYPLFSILQAMGNPTVNYFR